jgi:hypothetical protein
MARENIAMLHGQIWQKPKIYISKEGDPVKATFPIKVLRRPFLAGNGQIVGGRLYIDCPPVATSDPDLIKQTAGLSEGDMADVRGVLTTRDVFKTSACPSCGEKNKVPGSFVFVTAIHIAKRESGVSEEAALELLKERSEISNLIIIMGTVCRDPEFFASEEGKKSAQYQIAVNRRYHIKDGHELERTDYPWIKSFGKQAEEDRIRLETGSSVLINGAIQTRDITRKTVCGHCGTEYQWNEIVSEIFPYSTEYLMGCRFPERETGDGRS